MATVQDLIGSDSTSLYPSVLEKLNYLTSIENDEVVRWIVSAIKNLTDTYPFDELCLPNLPFVPLQPGISQYSTTYLMNGLNANVSRIDSFLLQVGNTSSNQNSSFGGNGLPTTAANGQVCIELKWRSIKVVNANSRIQAQPVMYTTYGQSSIVDGITTIILAFCPDQPYNVQICPQLKHPFTDGIHDEILVPDAWLEVIATAAALIGAQVNRMADNIQTLRTNLYGDPKGSGEPGLIKMLTSSRAQMSNVNERMLNMMVSDR